MRHKSHLKTSNANFARHRSSACQRRRGCSCWTRMHQWLRYQGILHQEQEWNGRTVLRPIAYGSKVLSDTEMKYGAPKAEMFAVITFVEKYRAYLGSAPFKLRVDDRAPCLAENLFDGPELHWVVGSCAWMDTT